MFTIYLLIIGLGVSELGFFITGYLIGKSEKKSQIIDKLSQVKTKWEFPISPKKDIVSKEDLRNDTFVGAVHRPSAEQIRKWNENPKVKAEKDELSKSFAQDPELLRTKQLRDDYIKSTNAL